MQNAYSLECWAARPLTSPCDSCMRTLGTVSARSGSSCPTSRSRRLFEAPTAVGYTSYPDNAIYEFSKKAVEAGLDIFRVFEWVPTSSLMCSHADYQLAQLRRQPEARYRRREEGGGVVEGTICYSGDVANPKRTKYTLEYYLDLTQQLVDEGIHVLGIKDMAGLLKPEAARM